MTTLVFNCKSTYVGNRKPIISGIAQEIAHAESASTLVSMKCNIE